MEFKAELIFEGKIYGMIAQLDVAETKNYLASSIIKLLNPNYKEGENFYATIKCASKELINVCFYPLNELDEKAVEPYLIFGRNFAL